MVVVLGGWLIVWAVGESGNGVRGSLLFRACANFCVRKRHS